MDVRGSALFQGVGIANNNDSTFATTRGLSIMLEDGDIDNTDAAGIFNYPVQIHNTYPQATSVANGREVGLCFSLYDSQFPGASGSYTPGAAITHERNTSWSKGKLHFKTKQTANSNSDCVTAMTISDDGNVGIGLTNPTAKLDVNGYILNNNPAFHAYKTGGASTTSTGVFNAFTDVFLNRGGHYYTSGGNVGKFIAPVAGVYYFSANMLHRQSGANGNAEITFYKNGTNISSRALGYNQVTGVSDHDNLHIETMIELAVDDYVQVAIHSLASSTDFYYGEGLADFRGFLIG